MIVTIKEGDRGKNRALKAHCVHLCSSWSLSCYYTTLHIFYRSSALQPAFLDTLPNRVAFTFILQEYKQFRVLPGYICYSILKHLQPNLFPLIFQRFQSRRCELIFCPLPVTLIVQHGQMIVSVSSDYQSCFQLKTKESSLVSFSGKVNIRQLLRTPAELK